MFLGAGASVASGIPATRGLIEEWQKEVFCGLRGVKYPLDMSSNASDSLLEDFHDWKDKEFRNWSNGKVANPEEGSDYSHLFEFFRQSKESRQTFIEDLITADDVEPSPGNIYLAGLMFESVIGCVLTTNFDDLVSDALFRYYNLRPIVCAFESSINNFNNSSTRPKIIKLHGDYLFNDIRNTDSELVALDVNMENKMIELCQDRGLVFVGYGGNDESIMEPILKQMHVNPRFLTKDLHWCILKKNTKIRKEGRVVRRDLPKLLWKLKSRFPKRVHIYEIESFDVFFSDVFDHAGFTVQRCLEMAKGRNVANSLRKAITKFKVRGKPSKRMVLDKEIAGGYLNETISEIQTEIERADTEWELGTFCRDREGEFKKAIINYSKGLNRLENLENHEGASDSEILKILRRRMGCEIGNGKCFYQLSQSKDTKKAFEGFLVTSEMVRNIYSNRQLDFECREIVSSCFFNIICGLCASVTKAKVKFETVVPDLKFHFAELKKLPDGLAKIEKLLEPDKDIEPYLEKIKGLLS